MTNPFVCVIWNCDPEHYLYVDTKLELDLRGKLFTALQQGSMITLVTPSSTTASLARDVEAAIVSVLDSQRLLSDRDVRRDRARRPLGAVYRAEIAQLLRELASKFQAPVQRFPEVAR